MQADARRADAEEMRRTADEHQTFDVLDSRASDARRTDAEEMLRTVLLFVCTRARPPVVGEYDGALGSGTSAGSGTPDEGPAAVVEYRSRLSAVSMLRGSLRAAAAAARRYAVLVASLSVTDAAPVGGGGGRGGRLWGVAGSDWVPAGSCGWGEGQRLQ